jgi:guanyl-specific ribonuclease Sa
MGLTWNRIASFIILLLAVIAISFYLLDDNGKHIEDVLHQTSSTPVDTIPLHKKDSLYSPADNKQEIPAYVLNVLNHVLKFQEAPPRHVGGREFFNREKKLATLDGIGIRIRYQEWDVHPKVQGQNRGAERLITGSDHSAYYTQDHYKTFIKIKP